MQQHFTIPPGVNEFRSPLRAELDGGAQSPRQVIEAQAKEPTYLLPSTVEKRLFYDFSKRGIDICVSTLLLVFALPLMVVIAAMIAITSSGEIIFKHRRLGRFAKEFDCWKFRTMVCNADELLRSDSRLQKEFEENYKITDDPRITRLGCFLRRTSLDELPQLIQVLQGTMSLVGPRPIIHRELEKYSIYGDKLLSVKPGVSGLWQTSGRNNVTYQERVLLDMYYVDHRGFLLDVKLILKTVVAVLKRSGAC